MITSVGEIGDHSAIKYMYLFCDTSSEAFPSVSFDGQVRITSATVIMKSAQPVPCRRIGLDSLGRSLI